MEVTVSHAASGRSCVVGVADIDTVQALKVRAVGEIFAGRRIDADRAAGGLAARIGTGMAEGGELDDAQRIADTRLEGGDHVHLVRRLAEVKAPAEYLTGEHIPSCIALSPCGRLCCAGARKESLLIFDTTTAELVTQLKVGGAPPISCVAFSWCGEWLAAGSHTMAITVWRTSTWQCVHTFESHTDWVLCVAWTHCGRLLSGSIDTTVRVWDVEEGVCTAVLEGHTDYVYGLAVSHTSIFSASGDGTIRVWELDTLSHTNTLTGHTDTVGGLALTTDEQQLVSCSDDKTLKVWCTKTGQCLQTVCTGKVLTSVVASQEGDFIVAVSNLDALAPCCLSTGKALKFPSGEDACTYVASSPCGRWLFKSNDVSIRAHPVSTQLQYAS